MNDELGANCVTNCAVESSLVGHPSETHQHEKLITLCFVNCKSRQNLEQENRLTRSRQSSAAADSQLITAIIVGMYVHVILSNAQLE